MKNYKIHAALLAAAFAVSGVSARADLKYTQTTSLGNGGAGSSSVTRMVRPGNERTETVINLGKVKMTTVTISTCKPKQEVRLDDSLKIYTVVDATGSASTSSAGAASASSGKGKTGKQILTYSLKDLGGEKVAGYQTRHYKVTMKSETSGCLGDRKSTTTMEMWVANIKNTVACAGTAANYGIPPAVYGGCKVTTVIKGDTAGMKKIGGGMTVRMKMYSGTTVVSTTEVSDVSQAKLSASLFKVPAGYKKVSEQDFQKAQSEAMAAAMANG